MRLLFYSFLSVLVFGCQQSKNNFGEAISKNPQEISKGKVLFEQHCSGCHNFKNTGIGPSLSGITHSQQTDWIIQMIKNPTTLVEQNDRRITELLQDYPTLMPSFSNLSDMDIDAILAYMHTFEAEKVELGGKAKGLSDPIPEKLSFAPQALRIEYLTQIPASSTAPPLARINTLSSQGANGTLFTNDLRGILYEIRDTVAVPFLNLAESMPHFVDAPGLGTGFGSFAFHPDFSTNGLLYTTHSEPAGTAQADFSFSDSIPHKLQWVVSEWKVIDFNKRKIDRHPRELLRIDFVGTIHGMQEIAFNPKATKSSEDYGKLYICLGDGSSVENGYKELAYHKGTKVWGSVLRIDPLGSNSANGHYGIPNDNPFIQNMGKAPEVFAYGFRNPNRLAWDMRGDLYVSDIGHNHIEELNRILPGHFYGWPIREGSFELHPDIAMDQIFPLPDSDETYGVTYPVLQYDHDEGAAISGGFFSTPNAYIFGDIPTGKLFVGDVDTGKIQKLQVSIGDSVTTLKKLTRSDRVDLKCGQDNRGHGYLLTKADGKIYRVVQ